MSGALLVVAKRPAPGQTKTRLSPPFSVEQASKLYECFLRDTLDLARSVPGISRLIAYAPIEGLRYFRSLAPDFQLLPQVGDDLGERLDNALTHCLGHGFEQAVILGSDCPNLPSSYISAAFDLLAAADVVLGPSEDGGYYLIGLKEPQPSLMRGVQMSTPNVLRDTLGRAEQLHLRIALAPSWYDVDTGSDLCRLKADLEVAHPGVAQHTRDFLFKPRTL